LLGREAVAAPTRAPAWKRAQQVALAEEKATLLLRT
jgi:hypothetical protein